MKPRHRIRPLIVFAVVFFAGAALAGGSLVKKWETPEVLKTPESVLFHDGVLFVANIDGIPDEKDGKGFISKISMLGEILELEWVKGLNAPKGMGLVDGFLYVTDIDRVVKIDMKGPTKVKEYPVPEAKFLNDIAVDGKKRVFISDSSTSHIYCIAQDQLELFLVVDRKGTNGLFAMDGFLYVGTRGALLRVDLEDRKPVVWIDGIASIDGVEPCGEGSFLVSDWRSKVLLVHPEREAKLLLDNGDIGMNAADIEYVSEKRLLLVPTFFDNRVFAYELKD